MLAPILALALAASPKLAVLPVTAGEGVTPTTAAALGEALSGEVRRRAGVEVVTQKEIAAVLSLEAQRSALGCTSDACMAELGGALGCDRLVTGTLARLGESWLVHLRVVETARARVAAQSDRRLRGGTIDDVLDALPAMVAELFPGGAPTRAPAPVPVARADAPPVPAPWVEEPVEVAAADRLRLAGWADPEGRLIVSEPFTGLDAPFWWGDGQTVFRLRLRGGGQSGTTSFSRAFWDPRARTGAQASLDVSGDKAVLTCGQREIQLRPVPAGDLGRRLAGTRFLAPRWRRIPHALARDDEGTYWYVDGARGADGQAVTDRPDFRLWVGKKGKLARVVVDDALLDSGGRLYLTASGRLEIKKGEKGMEAAWLAGGVRKALTWLEPSDHGPLLYGELGMYAGERLGTPCDGRL